MAVDWSGRAGDAGESLWLAEVRDGRLAELRNGWSRSGLIAHLVGLAEDDPDLVVGLDFAFSFPAWWCAAQGWRSGPEVWAALGREDARLAESLLAACEPPFWGRSGARNPNDAVSGLRRTERDDAPGAKSVFQIGGAGAVGTGSLRGMPHLATLASRGFSVWPFTPPGSPPGWPRVLEIYPRLLTRAGRPPVRAVVKTRWSARHAHMEREFPEQAAALRERAAGSEDGFDAAVSALVMSRHLDELRQLPGAVDSVDRIEGRIWRPG